MIGLGVVSQLIRIAIGIELTDPVFPKLLADRVAALSELRRHGHTTIEACLLQIVVVCGHRLAHRRHVLNRSALQRRAACDFNIPASIPCVAVPLPSAPRPQQSSARLPAMRAGCCPSRCGVPSASRKTGTPNRQRRWPLGIPAATDFSVVGGRCRSSAPAAIRSSSLAWTLDRAEGGAPTERRKFGMR